MRFLLAITGFLFFLSGKSQDTLNQIDKDGKKTGYWVITNEKLKKPNFALSDTVEKGWYVAGRKEGIYNTYYPGNKLKVIYEAKNNRPNGKFTTFYESGIVEEKGTWKQNRFVDTFLRYHKNGVMAQKKYFNMAGKVEGWVYYYFDTGEIEISFYCKNGVEITDSGGINTKYTEVRQDLKEYTPEQLCFCHRDSIKNPIIYNNPDSILSYWISYYSVTLKGKFKNKILDSGMCQISSKKYPYQSPIKYLAKNGKLIIYVEPIKSPYPKLTDGYGKIYNSEKQLVKDGLFQDGKLKNGKLYIYDKDGLLVKIEVYKDFKYAGDVELDDLIDKEKEKK